MTIKSTQKIIKIGSSAGVTIPARDLKHANAKVGDEVQLTVRFPDSKIEPSQSNQKLDSEYQAFKAEYHQTLKNLVNR